jgi:hypothetical protein
MVPALRHGDRLVIWARPARRTPRVGRVVIVELPDRPLSVKRIAAIDKDGRIQVVGDNAFASTDSRMLGSLPATAVRGVAVARLWPRPGPVRARRGPPG